MDDGMTTASIRWAASRFGDRIDAAADELNTLDAALGDGDLGVTLARAGARLTEDLPNLPEDIGMALFRCAKAFTGISASTYGTLLATGLMAAAKETKGKTIVSWSQVPELLGKALQAMCQRGKGQIGDKTVLDAIKAARDATEGLDEPAGLLAAANRAVAEAINEVRAQPFRQGRARIFGAKGIGRDDPGMVAFKRILESLEKTTEPNP